jgi:hypothetical protein
MMDQALFTLMPVREGDTTISRRRSNVLATARARQLLIEQVLLMVEEGSLAGESLLQTHGKAAFRQGLEERPEISDAGVAQRIQDAITGYIFRAWRHRQGALTPGHLQDFRQRALEGIEQGAVETRRLLQVLGGRGIASDHALLRTLDLLRERLDRWFGHQRQSLTSQL